MASCVAQQRVVLGPLVFTSDFDGGNMGRVERTPLPWAPTRTPVGTSDAKGARGSSGCSSGLSGNHSPAGRCHWAADIAEEVEQAEYGITVSPDCAGTPQENGYRTWFYFGVSLADPSEDVCSIPSQPNQSPCGQAPSRPLKAAVAPRRRRAERNSAVEVFGGDDNAEASASAEGETDHDLSGGEDMAGSGSEAAGQPFADAVSPPLPQEPTLPAAQAPSARAPGPAEGATEVQLGSHEKMSPVLDQGITLHLAVRNMNNQGKLYKQGYRPWVRTLPEEPRWRRLPDTRDSNFSFEWTGEPAEGGGGFVIRWRYRLLRRNSTAYFAFCVPSGYEECKGIVDSIEEALHSRPEGQVPSSAALDCITPEFASAQPLGCLSRVLQEDWVPRLGAGIYFHRQPLQQSLEGRDVELLTLTAAGNGNRSSEQEEIVLEEPPHDFTLAGDPPRRFPDRPLVFVSARVHPGETPAQFVFYGLLRFLLSDDPRAVELRNGFVFKLVPMLNPDGVARGHYRTNSRGLNLNRYYDNPTPEEHEGVWAAKRMLVHWAAQGRLLLYLDLHGHATKRGCFLLANRLIGASQAWNSGYARLCQINSPHFDLDGCEFTDLGAAEEKGKDGLGKQGSGRVSVYRDCHLCHSYTLECNYNSGRFSKPVGTAIGLPVWAECPGSYCRTSLSVPYTPGSWAQVGEALCVSLLDMYGHNCFSRLPGSKYGSVARMIGSSPCLRAGSGCRVVTDITTQASNLATIEAVHQRERDCHRTCCWEERRRKVSRGTFSKSTSASNGSANADMGPSARRSTGKAARGSSFGEGPPAIASSRPSSSSRAGSCSQAKGALSGNSRGRASSTAAPAAAASTPVTGMWQRSAADNREADVSNQARRTASNAPRRRTAAGSDATAASSGLAEHRRFAPASGSSPRSTCKRASGNRSSGTRRIGEAVDGEPKKATPKRNRGR